MTDKTPLELVAEIKRLTKLIDKTQGNYDSGKFKGYEAAVELQKYRRDRGVAISLLNLSESNLFAILPPKPFKLKSKLVEEKRKMKEDVPGG
jgi:hypothetical protein